MPTFYGVPFGNRFRKAPTPGVIKAFDTNIPPNCPIYYNTYAGCYVSWVAFV